MTKEEIKAKIVKPSYTNPWKWGDVEVKGTYRGLLTSSEYLGACSYKNQKDFITNSGYCDDMKATVLNSLNSQLQTLLV
ncbi:hypothetical protein Q5H92_14970 [Hymenobacter sp. M29]|uniref:Uncharacterized protein n=1 Tax=Hymenobacter mellowenesis TaxID=3063995 RepID=A0ABT9AE65_9BACT|nr:hypothetical protein [Hymenobacter sp. M29]MDO7847669.1 hypothetical protein [Hymenobacter sp. M29]